VSALDVERREIHPRFSIAQNRPCNSQSDQQILDSWLTAAPRYAPFPPTPEVPEVATDVPKRKRKRRTAPIEAKPELACDSNIYLKWEEYSKTQAKKCAVGKSRTAAPEAGGSPAYNTAEEDADADMEDAEPPGAVCAEPAQKSGDKALPMTEEPKPAQAPAKRQQKRGIRRKSPVSKKSKREAQQGLKAPQGLTTFEDYRDCK